MSTARRPVCVVTGGARGIGFAIAQRLCRAGTIVVVADIDSKGAVGAADALRTECGEAVAVTLDVADAAGVHAAFAGLAARFDGLDQLVNNAGLIDRQPFLDFEVALWERMLAVNLGGTFHCSQAFAREAIRRRAEGRIVNVASISGQQGGTGRAAYGASKAGIINLTATMAIELAPHGILVNAVAPGPIRSEAPDLDSPRSRATLSRLSQPRFGRPDEVAAAVGFLLSRDCSFTSGHVLNVDGGFHSTGITYDPQPSRWLQEARA